MVMPGLVLSLVICVLAVVVVGLIVAAVLLIHRWAKNHPNPTYSIEDPETGISEEEWMNAIR